MPKSGYCGLCDETRVAMCRSALPGVTVQLDPLLGQGMSALDGCRSLSSTSIRINVSRLTSQRNFTLPTVDPSFLFRVSRTAALGQYSGSPGRLKPGLKELRTYAVPRSHEVRNARIREVRVILLVHDPLIHGVTSHRPSADLTSRPFYIWQLFRNGSLSGRYQCLQFGFKADV